VKHKHAQPMISVAAASGIIEAIMAAGGNPDQILRAVGLSRSVISDEEGFIPTSVFARLLEEGAQSTGDDCFGLHFGERYDPKNIGALVYVVLNSPTMAAAVENAGRYLRLHNEAAQVDSSIEGHHGYIRVRLARLAIKTPRQLNEYNMAVALNTIRMMAGSQWTPQEVQFAHEAPREISEHLRVFHAPVTFGCMTNAFVIDREFIERQVPAASRQLYKILKQYLERLLNEMPAENGLIASVRRIIAELIRDGAPKLPRVAKEMAMSPRTLQRQLKEYGVNFKELVENTRRLVALNYLRNPMNTLTEIAFLLGYSELSAFNRAFKRWTGSTPLNYRRRLPR
jgi:AraC-like DNA-binding protein